MKVDFLICSERSGSNLITKLIDNHSLYCGPTPPHLLRVFINKLDSYNNLSDDKNWEIFVTDIFEFYNSKIGVWESTITKKELLNIKPRNLAEVVKYIYHKETLYHNKKHAFIKEVKTYSFFDYLNENYEHSKFVWLVRDPRDMALSWSQSPVHRGDIVRATKIWKEDQQETFKLYEKYRNKILLIKYEDLVSNQIEALKLICTFLDIPFESAMVEFHKSRTSKENAIQTDNWKNLDKEIITDNFKKYQKKLSQEQIQYIEYVCKNEMKTLLYELNFPLLSKDEFTTIEMNLSNEDRYEKPEYLLISDSEKEKRKKWYDKFLEIQER